MGRVDDTTRTLVFASDVAILDDGSNRFRVDTSTRSVEFEIEDHALKDFRHSINEVIQRLNTSDAWANQLSASERRTIVPYVEDLIGLGVLLSLDTSTGVEDEADLQLLTFLSRRVGNGEEAYRKAKKLQFRLAGPNNIVEVLRIGLLRQGISVNENADEETDSIVVHTIADYVELDKWTRQYASQKQAWVPISFTPSSIVVGPWVSPGETACPNCSLGETGLHEQRARSLSSAWLSAQPGALNWASGVLVHQALRVIAPMGPHHPWGVMTDLDVLRFEQVSRRIWRNPYCSVCGRRGPSRDVWSRYE